MQNSFYSLIQKHEKIIGTIASLLAVIMFFSLIEVLLSNLRGESQIVVQPFATAVSGLFWSLYGFSRKDWIIIVPNMVALILGILTVISAFI